MKVQVEDIASNAAEAPTKVEEVVITKAETQTESVESADVPHVDDETGAEAAAQPDHEPHAPETAAEAETEIPPAEVLSHTAEQPSVAEEHHVDETEAVSEPPVQDASMSIEHADAVEEEVIVPVNVPTHVEVVMEPTDPSFEAIVVPVSIQEISTADVSEPSTVAETEAEVETSAVKDATVSDVVAAVEASVEAAAVTDEDTKPGPEIAAPDAAIVEEKETVSEVLIQVSVEQITVKEPVPESTEAVEAEHIVPEIVQPEVALADEIEHVATAVTDASAASAVPVSESIPPAAAEESHEVTPIVAETEPAATEAPEAIDVVEESAAVDAVAAKPSGPEEPLMEEVSETVEEVTATVSKAEEGVVANGHAINAQDIPNGSAPHPEEKVHVDAVAEEVSSEAIDIPVVHEITAEPLVNGSADTHAKVMTSCPS